MVELSFNEITDFINCPLYYKFKYIDKLRAKNKGIKDFFKKTIHKTIHYFFNIIKDEKRIPSDTELRNYWGDLWFADLDTEKIIYGNSSEKSRLTKKGYELLQKFYRSQKGNPGIPVDINLKYNINFNKYNILGNIELIREINNKIQVVYFSTATYALDEFRQKNDVGYTLSVYAFREIFKRKEDQLVSFHLKTCKEIYLHRDRKNIEKVLSSINNIYKIIENDLWYWRDSYLCKQCEYQEHCINWRG